MRAPKVSVVTPSYNHARFLRQRIETILAQTFTDFEWIIVDDASSDGSREILQELAARDGRVRFYANEQNLGMPTTVNRAIAESRGKYVYRAESDDACAPRLLERFVTVLEKNPCVGLVHCRGLRIDEANRVWGGRRQSTADRVQSGREVFTRIVLGNDIMGCNMMFTRAAHDEVGGFAVPPFESVCDYDFALRLCLKYDVAYVGDALGFHRVHGNNLSSKFQRTLDVEFFMKEQYEVLSRAFEAAKPEWGRMPELETTAFSRRTATTGADAFLLALRSRNLCVAKELRQRFQAYDPAAASSLYWFTLCIRRFGWRVLLQLYRHADLALR
jgi:glycosyltransferase involved in cell wall biosynthesis